MERSSGDEKGMCIDLIINIITVASLSASCQIACNMASYHCHSFSHYYHHYYSHPYNRIIAITLTTITLTAHTHRDLGESDFDIMMQRRKEAMARAKRRRKKVNYCSEIHVRYIIIILHYFHQDGDSAASIDLIVEMIHQMKQAAEVCVCYMGAFCSVEVCAVTG